MAPPGLSQKAALHNGLREIVNCSFQKRFIYIDFRPNTPRSLAWLVAQAVTRLETEAYGTGLTGGPYTECVVCYCL